ncbi:MAG: hypothetical protein CBC49_011150 [Alphaproteobacteria bacterium TMED89]|nr:MAG: hypothetical protein CBC49_011150 [Alphaproteobacteria bacterium TMED89]
MSSEPSPFDDLKLGHDVVWNELREGVQKPRHAFHWPTLCYLDGFTPVPRTVVLRNLDRSEKRFEMHTDARSRKAAVIPKAKHASLSFYDPRKSLQVTVMGRIEMLDPRKEETELAWAKLTLATKTIYANTIDPGTAMLEPENTTVPVDEMSTEDLTRARKNFRVLHLTADRLEVLSLKGNHRRLLFDYGLAGQRRAAWLAP